MKHITRIGLSASFVDLALLIPGFMLSGVVAQAQTGSYAVEVQQDIKHDISPPLRDMIAPPGDFKAPHEKHLGRPIPGTHWKTRLDQALQTSAASLVAVTNGLNFDGVGEGFVGPNGTFLVTSAPPDTNGTVGATQFVQWVNTSFAVFDKTTGSVLMGPTAGNAIWLGFGGGCETNNDGDAIAQYDKASNRWILTQFSVSTTPYLQCVAVSTTSDATGPYFRYAFTQPDFNDYPKTGVWPDAYYQTFNMFSGNTFLRARACALDRSKMLAGVAATQVCFQANSEASLLPSDLDGSTPPPSGSPNFLVDLATNTTLNLFKFHVDFNTPANSTFTGPTVIPVAAFSPACGGGVCIPQPGTSQQLDSLADRLMYRLAYRNFGDHEALVVNHSVTAGSSVGVRWYEIRDPNGTPTIFQQGTFAPDSNFRWMGSIGMDSAGDIALGYSVSSSSTFPSIRFTGRTPTDTLNTLEAESSIQAGAGSQNGRLDRWGDYSSIAIDPVDDCTFWYTNEYFQGTGSFNWNTRIASFKFPGCGSLTSTTTTLASSLNPSTYGQSVTVTAMVTQSSGTATPTGNVTFKDGATILGTGALANGQTTLITTSLAVGSHSITGVYAGNATFAGSASPVLTQTVKKPATSTAVATSLNPSTYGQSVTITATVMAVSGAVTPTGNVNFEDGTSTLAIKTLINGQATFVTSTLSGGAHSISAVYGGSTTFAGSTSPIVTQTVNPIATTTSLTSSLNPSTYGQSVTLTAMVTPAAGAIAPTGTVTFKDGTTTIGAKILAGGQATFVTSTLSGGAHSITVVYAGNTNFTGSTSPVLTQTVNSIATTTSLTSSLNPSTYGQSVTLTAVVTPATGTIAPTGTVTFKDGTTAIAGKILTGGQATFVTSTLSGGAHSITVVYAGNTNFNGSTSPVLTQTVNSIATTTSLASSLNPSTYGQSVTLTAVVTPATGAIAPTGTVTFKDGTTTIGAKYLASGQAAFVTSTLSGGAHSITVVYAGNTNFNGSTSPVLTQTVNSIATTTSLASSLNLSTYGQSVTLTAVVAPASGTIAPTGIVTFKDGTTVIATRGLVSGEATFVTSTLSGGAHSITVVYAGNTNFTGSSSPVLTQTVNP